MFGNFRIKSLFRECLIKVKGFIRELLLVGNDSGNEREFCTP